MNKREQLLSDAQRKRVRQWLAEGASVSAIAKREGMTYTRAKQLAEQERGAA